jgi:hypothetical protein
MRRRNRLISLAALLFVELPLGAQEWANVGQGPPFARVLVADSRGTFVGLSVDRTGQVALFRTALEGKPRLESIDYEIGFLAAGTSAHSDRVCAPRTDNSTIVCWDLDLRVVERFAVPGKVASLAMTRDDEIWILPPSPPGSSPNLIQWQRGSGGWTRTGRALRFDTIDRTPRIESSEVRAVDEKTLALVPLMGSFEANQVTYPAPWIWSTESGPAARLAPRTLPVDRAIQDSLRRVPGLPLRLVFTSTASRSHVAIIPALLQADDRPPRHDEVWWRDFKQGSWRASKLPGPVGAIALGERDVFAATEDGRIWRHTIAP